VLLIVSAKRDVHADAVVLQCAARGAPVLRLNTEDYPSRVGLDLHLSAGRWTGSLRVSGQPAASLDDIHSVWYRRWPSASADHVDPEMAAFVRAEAGAALAMLWQALEDRFWMSWPFAIQAAEEKAGQLTRAHRFGLATPRTTITSDPTQIEALLDESGPRLAAKRIGGGRTMDGFVFTTVVDRALLEAHRDEIDVCPVLVQEYVPKQVEIRAAVVGETVFAAEIHSQGDERTRHDLRAGGLHLFDTPHARHELPVSVAEALVALTRSYGLTFSAPDLILTPEGEYVFLDLNPNGQWGWIENLAGLPILATLTDLLLRGRVAP
jgi:glutathione synthase/RimK-type ligase-like ATP-grasp enzyme